MQVQAGVFQQIGAAHDLIDALQRIVDDDRQVVSVDSVISAKHKIANFAFEIETEFIEDTIVFASYRGYRPTLVEFYDEDGNICGEFKVQDFVDGLKKSGIL